MFPLAVAGILLQLHADAAEWKKAGLSAVANGRIEAALPAFREACSLAPDDEDACYYLARALYSLDRWEEAQEPFRLAASAASKSMLPRVHRAAALNFVALNRPAEAELHFKEAIRLNRGPDDPRLDYGAFLFRQGRLKESLSVLREAARANPGSARAHAELGRTLLHLRDTDNAVRTLEKAVSLAPDSREFHLMLGRAYLQSGRLADGERQLALASAQGSSTSR